MQTESRKKSTRKYLVATVHVHASFNNTIITFSDLAGNVISWSSSGKCGFKGSKKSTPYAASMVAEDAASRAISNFGTKTVSIILRGPGSGRESSVRAIAGLGIKITLIRDDTDMPHNGCRPPKKRRV